MATDLVFVEPTPPTGFTYNEDVYHRIRDEVGVFICADGPDESWVIFDSGDELRVSTGLLEPAERRAKE